MAGVEVIQARLREASSLAELLAVSFDAFEAIRVLARSSEDTVPGLFAALMTTADAAVDGREAITIAPSLSWAPGSTPFASPAAADPGIETITDALAALGALLNEGWPMLRSVRPYRATVWRAQKPPGRPAESIS